MSANLNADLSLNILLERILNAPYGFFICCVVISLILLVTLIFFIAKSGVISGLREYQEYKARKIKEEIKDQEDLLEDVSFKKYKHQIQYNLDVAKLNKLLKYSHRDKELLEYILSCKNHQLAIMNYDSSKEYLEKDQSTKKYKLKDDWRIRHADKLSMAGSFIYFSICYGSFSPTIYVVYSLLRAGESLKNIPLAFVASQFLLFIMCVVLALTIYLPMIRPLKAKKFLELEKIEDSST